MAFDYFLNLILLPQVFSMNLIIQYKNRSISKLVFFSSGMWHSCPLQRNYCNVSFDFKLKNGFKYIEPII